MRILLGIVGFVFLILGAVSLVQVMGRRPDTEAGAAVFAVLFFTVAIICGTGALRGVNVGGHRVEVGVDPDPDRLC
jgi:hypothetical protein